MEKTFGQAFGDLIREKRGQEELTQKELAIKAFDDESKVRRIIELEKGAVKRPHVKTVDALIAFFGITKEELERCRQHGLFTPKEQSGIGLPRALLENLALRFEYDNPDAVDAELISFLKDKAEELKRLKRRLAEIEGSTTSLNNQIEAANSAIEGGHFDEADEILAAAEEIQQEEKTLKEIRAQSKIRFARGDTALFNGKNTVAANHYLKAADYFLGFNPQEAQKILTSAAGQIYELERRSRSPNFSNALDLAERAANLASPEVNRPEWVRAKYRLALLQQSSAQLRGEGSLKMLGMAIDNVREALKHSGSGTPDDDFDWASLIVLLGNCYLERGHRDENPNWESDITTAIDTFDGLTKDPRIETLTLHRCYVYNNLSAACNYKSRRSGEGKEGAFAKRAEKALTRAIDLSAQDGQIDVWSAAQSNLGARLAEAATDSGPEMALFLRIQAISAFNASIEAYGTTLLTLQMANTQMALGRVLLDCARSVSAPKKEVYLARSIHSFEVASEVFRESNSLAWSQAQFHIGLAFLLHSEISDDDTAKEDLNNALSCFDAAFPGFQSAEAKPDLEKLQAAQQKAAEKLESKQA